MKRNSLIAFSALVAAGTIASFAESTVNYNETLGTVMFVGDSITHGVNSASWRWAFHKILTDDGISYDSVGYKSGNYSGGVASGTQYGGVEFNNVHSSQASARAWEVSGRKAGTRFDGTNIKNWLGLSSTKTNGAAYSGPVFDGENTPDTYFMLLGTNDLLSDSGTDYAAKTTNILNDFSLIVSAMRESNDNAEINVFTVPCWTNHGNHNDADSHSAVAAFNEALKTWAEQNVSNGVKVIEINRGILDVASSTPFFGCSSMFNNPGTDGLHPNAQGDLLMAGNLAKALGYAGRSAGQIRKAGEDFSIQLSSQESFTSAVNVVETAGTLDLGSAGTSNLTYSWDAETDLSNGFSLDFGLVFGNGSTDGWNTTDNLSISLGNGAFYGTLEINEAYIQWNNTVIFSTDMSALAEDYGNIRIAYIAGNTAEGLNKGYYVWLDDMLIGEALSRTYSSSAVNGVEFRFSDAGTVLLSNVALESVSCAPTTTGIVNEAGIYLATPQPPSTKGVLGIRNDWEATTTIAASGAYAYANTGNHTGAVYAEITSGSASSWIGGHSSGTQTGDVYLRVCGAFAGAPTAFGAVNGTSVAGNVYLELSSESAEFESFTKTNPASVVGSFATNITGNLDIVINDGTYRSAITGGVFSGNNTIGGNTSVYINGGTFYGNIYAGGLTGTQTGDVLIAISGNAANFTASTEINGGVRAAAASIGGNSTILIKDVTPGPELYSIEKFTGTLNGGTGVAGTRSLVIDNANLDLSGATLINFDVISIVNGSDVKLSSFGTAGTLRVDSASLAIMSKINNFQTLAVGNDAVFSGTLAAGGTLFFDISEATENSYTIKLGGLSEGASLDNIRFVSGENYYAAELTDIDWQAGSATVVLGDEIAGTVKVISSTATTAANTFSVVAASGVSGNAQVISTGAVSTQKIYASSADYTGDLIVTLDAGTAASWVGAQGASGTLSGNVSLKIAGSFVSAPTVFGIVNATSVSGDITLEFSAENASFTTFTATNAASVVGSYQGNVGGDMNIIVNAGTFNSAIMGGIHTGAKTIGGNVNITVNGGTIKGNIYGGGVTGTIAGGTNIVIDNSKGTLALGNTITISGGGTTASAGTIAGDASITIKNPGGLFDNFTGTITGGANVAGTKTLTLDGVTADLSGVTISNFDALVVQNSSAVALVGIDVSGTKTLTISNSALKVGEVAGTLNFSSIGGGGNVQMDENSSFERSASFSLNETAVGSFASDETIALGDSSGTYMLVEIKTAALTLAGTQSLTVSKIKSESTTLGGNSALIVDSAELGALAVADSASLEISGTVSAGTLDLSSAGSGAVNVGAAGRISASSLKIGTAAGTVKIADGGELDFGTIASGTLVFSQHDGIGNIWTHETSLTMADSFGIDTGLTGEIVSTEGSVSFANGDGDYTLAGLETGTLWLSDNQTLAVSGTLLVRESTTLGGNSALIVDSADLGALTVADSASLEISGTVSAGTLDLSGASDVSISGAGTGTFAGTIDISDALSNVSLAISKITIDGNVLLNGETNSLLLADVTITGDLEAGAGTLNYSGTNRIEGGLLVKSAVSLNAAAGATLTSESMIVDGADALLTFDGELDTKQVLVRNGARLVENEGGIVDKVGLSADAMFVQNGGTLGTLTVKNSQFTQNGGSTEIVTAAENSVLEIYGGSVDSLTISDSSVDFSENASVKNITIKNGTSTFKGTLAAETISLENNAVLKLDGATLSGTMNFAGGNRFELENGATLAQDLIVDAAISNLAVSVANSTITGRVSVAGTGNTLTVENATLSETIEISDGASLEQIGGSLGSIALNKATFTQLVGTVENLAAKDAEIKISGTAMTVSASNSKVTLAGTSMTEMLELDASTLEVAGEQSLLVLSAKSGESTVSGGNGRLLAEMIAVAENAVLTVSGITLAALSFDLAENSNLVLADGTIFDGDLTLGGDNAGTLTISASSVSGDLTLAAEKATLVLNSANIEGNLTATAGILKLEGENTIAKTQSIGPDVVLISATGANSTVEGTVSGTLTVEKDSVVTQNDENSSVAAIDVSGATFTQTAGKVETITLSENSTATIAGTVETLIAESNSDLVQNDGEIASISMNASNFTQNNGTAGNVLLENSATATIAGTVASLTLTESSSAEVAGTVENTTIVASGAALTVSSETAELAAVKVSGIGSTFTQTAGTVASLTAEKEAKIVQVGNVAGDVSLADGAVTTKLSGTIGGALSLENSKAVLTGTSDGTTDLSGKSALLVDAAGTISGTTMLSGTSKVLMAGTLALNLAANEKVTLNAGTSWSIRQGAKLSLSYRSPVRAGTFSSRAFAASSVNSALEEYLLNGNTVTIFENNGGSVSLASNTMTYEAYLRTDDTLAAIAGNNLIAYDLSNGLSVRITESDELFSQIRVPANLANLFDAVSSEEITGFVNLGDLSTAQINDPVLRALAAAGGSGADTLTTLSPLAYASMIAIPQAIHGDDIRAIAGRLDARRYDKYTGKNEAEVFVRVSGQNTENDKGLNSPNYDFYTTGVLVGADSKVRNGVLGMAVGAGSGRAKIHNDGGKIESSNLRLNLFAGMTFADYFYVNAGTHFGFGSYDIKRKTVLGNSNGDTNGINLGANLELGCLVPLVPSAGLFAMPHIGAAYLFSSVDGFGDSVFKIDDFDSTGVRGNAGVTFAWQATTDLRLTLDFSYSHEFCDSEAGIDYAYNASPLNVDAPIGAEDTVSGTFGFETSIYRNQSVFGGYTFSAGSHSEISHSVNFGLRARF